MSFPGIRKSRSLVLLIGTGLVAVTLAHLRMSGFAHQAEQLKQEGNKHFKNGDFGEAAELYSKAIQKNSTNPLLFTNRANARLKLHQWEHAIDDCIRSIELLPDNMKAYFYLGTAAKGGKSRIIGTVFR